MVTPPLCERDRLDYPGLERLIEHILGGVSGGANLFPRQKLAKSGCLCYPEVYADC